MPTNDTGADISRSALVIVDMQNEFLHKDGNFPNIAREHPEFGFDIPFLQGTIAPVSRLANAFRTAERPVIYVAHVLKPDYSDAAFPYWRVGLDPKSWNRTHCVEGTWGAEIVDELRPHEGEPVIVKKGFRRLCKHAAGYHTPQRWRDHLRCRWRNDMRLCVEYRARWRRTQLSHDFSQ